MVVAPQTRPPSAAALPAQAPRATVLVVDDGAESLATLGAVLQPRYRVLVARDGATALRLAEGADPPDLILLDVMMPGLTGYEVCGRLKGNPARRDIPVIFVTSLGAAEDERRGLDLGAADYVSKPLNPGVVLARVRNHLELRRAQQALARQNAVLEDAVAARTADLVRAQADLKEGFLETIDLAYGVMREADEYLGNHCKRVAGYAADLGAKLGFDAEAAFDLRVAALLHDIGLVGLAESEVRRLFRAPRPSPAGDALYWSHPVAQVPVMSKSARFSRVAGIIALHHECLDGSGFPAGVKAGAIPTAARLLAVADRWDVFSQAEESTRPVARSHEAFRAAWSGRLDPGVMAALGEVLRKGDPFSAVVDLRCADLHAGQVLAQTVRTTRGVVLLAAGTVLGSKHLLGLAGYASEGNLQQPVRVYQQA